MGDPLSAIASVLTLMGAGSQLANGLKKFRQLKSAPDVVLALQNEISVIHCVLDDIQSLLERCAQEDFQPRASFLVRAAERTKATHLAVDCLIYYDLLIIDSKDTCTKIDKVRWLGAESKVQRLQTQIHSNRRDLMLGLDILISSVGIEAISQNRQIIVLNKDIDSVSQQIINIHTRPSNRLDNTHTQSPRISGSLLNDSSNLSYDLGIASVGADLGTNSATVSQTSLGQGETPITFQVISTQHCRLDCNCLCHRNNITRTPRIFNSILGSLFLGYRAAPWFAEPCNDLFCRPGTIRASYKYAFPQWFLKRVVQASLFYNHTQGPELLLRVIRVKAYDDIPFKFIDHRHPTEMWYEKVKGAIENGEASVLDVSPDGRTLLHYALFHSHIKLMEYLLKNGADPYSQDENGSMPYVSAWRTILSEPRSYRADRFSRLFDQSHLSLLGFSKLHLAYLGLSGDDFLTILASIDRKEINVKDIHSRTIISWAITRGDRETVRRLLACGADPNIPNCCGKTSLHLATELSTDGGCIRELIEAKAEVNFREGVGRTPLMIAAVSNSPESVRTLIRSGAGVNIVELNEWSALDHAVEADHHDTLAALLQEVGPTSSLIQLKPNSLRFMAHHADRESLQILVDNVEKIKFATNQSEESFGLVFKCALTRIANESYQTGSLHLTNEEPFDESKNFVEWLILFVELACQIYNLPYHYASKVIRECHSKLDNGSGDSTDSSNSGDHDDNDESSSDEEQWHDTREG